MVLPKLLRSYACASLVMLGLSLSSWLVFTHMFGLASHTFRPVMLPSSLREGDLLCFKNRFQHFRSPSFFSEGGQPFNYPAPLAVLFSLVFKLPHPGRFLLIFSLCSYCAAGVAVIRNLLKRHMGWAESCTFVGSVMISSFPFLLMFYLLNIELAVWLVLALGITSFVRERNWLAAVCFGAAGSMKYFPLLYLFLLLPRRKFREAATGLLVCSLMLIICTYIEGPTFLGAISGLKAEMVKFNHFYLYDFNPSDNAIDHSLFALIKDLFVFSNRLPELKHLVLSYLGFAGVLSLGLSTIAIRNLPQINQIAVISICAVLFPPISHDYTLVHLYGLFLLFVFYVIEQGSNKRLWLVFGCFLVLFSSENYLSFQTSQLTLGLAGQLKCITLIGLGVMCFVFKFPELRETGKGLDESMAPSPLT